jgi:hypothetical protein
MTTSRPITVGSVVVDEYCSNLRIGTVHGNHRPGVVERADIADLFEALRQYIIRANRERGSSYTPPSIASNAPAGASGPWCENCGDAFTGPERDCPKPAPGRPYKECGRGGHMFRLERDPAKGPVAVHAASDLPPPEERIVVGIIERRAEPAFAASVTPFVGPATLLEIACRSGEKIERIGGASVEIYTVLGWLRIYESKSLGPAELLFSFPPRESEPR